MTQTMEQVLKEGWMKEPTTDIEARLRAKIKTMPSMDIVLSYIDYHAATTREGFMQNPLYKANLLFIEANLDSPDLLEKLHTLSESE